MSRKSVSEEMKSYRKLKILIILSFGFVAILTSSAAPVLLQEIKTMNVTPVVSSFLPASRYALCIICGLCLAAFIVKIGYKTSILLGLLGTLFSSGLMLCFHNYIFTLLFFIMLGLDYSLIKMSFYSIIKLITKDRESHVKFVSYLEGVYMCGVVSGFWIFSLAVVAGNWLYIYYFFVLCSVVLGGLFICIEVPETKPKIDKNIKSTDENTEESKPVNKFFLFSLLSVLILYLALEKSCNDWLPTFDSVFLHISNALSIQIAGFFGASMAAGRLLFPILTRKVEIKKAVKIFLLLAVFCLVLLILLLQKGNHSNTIIFKWSKLPISAFALPLFGFFVAPLFPVISSELLNLFSAKRQSFATGLIISVGGVGSIAISIIMGNAINFLGFTGIVSLILSFVLGIFFIYSLYNVDLKMIILKIYAFGGKICNNVIFIFRLQDYIAVTSLCVLTFFISFPRA